MLRRSNAQRDEHWARRPGCLARPHEAHNRVHTPADSSASPAEQERTPLLAPRFTGNFFNEFVVRAPESVNKELLKKKIIGGLPLGRFYPELADSMLLCATEMTRRADMDVLVAQVTGPLKAAEQQEVLA